MGWKEHYKKNAVSADEAVRLVKSGDVVRLGGLGWPQPKVLIDALGARREQLQNVEVRGYAPTHDPGWLQEGWESSIRLRTETFLGSSARPALDEGIIDYSPVLFSQTLRGDGQADDASFSADVMMVVVSPPNENGFCSFGSSLWEKRVQSEAAGTVLAQVDDNQVRTYGSNYVHATQIDKFVHHTPPILSLEESQALVQAVDDPEARALLTGMVPLIPHWDRAELLPMFLESDLDKLLRYSRMQAWSDPPDETRKIVGYVSELMRDGDTLQIGTGTTSAYLAVLGAFDGRKDLGWHSEIGARGIINLIEKGVVTGARKTVNPGRALFTSLHPLGPEELSFAIDNPIIELRDVSYVNDIRTIAAHDSMVSINNAMSVDLSGQINSESIGHRIYNGTGGQPEFHIGAVLSEGGRAITLLYSTAQDGKTSRIVPALAEGSGVTVPRTFADIVVTEYGIARLRGKSFRERAQELISVAHPDFRPELKRAANQLYYH